MRATIPRWSHLHQEQRLAVVIEVDGLPPLKNEALSLFNPGHTQITKVRALLEAVPLHERADPRQELPDVPFHTGVSMSVTLWGPNDLPGDATNYLGGIEDTRQKQGKDGFTEELGHLASVAVIIDDKQIVEVTEDTHTDSCTAWLRPVAADSTACIKE